MARKRNLVTKFHWNSEILNRKLEIDCETFSELVTMEVGVERSKSLVDVKQKETVISQISNTSITC